MFDNLFRSGQGDIPDMPIRGSDLNSSGSRNSPSTVSTPTPIPASEDWVLIRSAS